MIFAYNAAAERMLGVPKAEVLNRPVPQTAALLPRAFFLSAESGQASGRDAHIVRFHHTDFSVSSAPIVRKGAVKGYFTMLQPFAEEERTQQKLRLQMLKKGYTTKYCFDDIIAECPEMVRAKTIAEKMAATDASILLVGESGTGKELFAHSIHHSSPRKDMPFVAINCAALPEDLLESELFGYAEGAFTGAKKGGKLGLFEYAHHGTLFLDEIEGMSPNLQVKLLRVLQEKEIMRVGGSDIIPAGAFDVNPETKATIAGTFHYIDKTPVAPWTALGYIYDGMVSLAGTICLLLYFGGIFGVFLSLGAAEEVVNGIVVRMQGKADTLIFFVLTFLMSTIGAFAANNALIAFCALGAIVSRKMKLDPLVGIGIFFYGTFVGFASGPMCAYVAQGIAGVELYSGFAMRTFWWLVCTFVVAVYTACYARRIKKDPAKSLMGNTAWLEAAEEAEAASASISASAVVVMLLLFGGTFFMAYALNTLKWDRGLCFAFLAALAVISAVIRGKNVEEIVKSFSTGCAGMAFICFVMGAAAAIGTTLTKGNVLPTIINAVTVPLSQVSTGVSAALMFVMNAVINFLIPSRGGQAAVVIPIMAPIGDMLGITRQVVVSAFNMGDGITNMINPLDGATMGAVALAGVGSFGKYAKWAIPLTLILMVMTCVFLGVLAVMGWTGV